MLSETAMADWRKAGGAAAVVISVLSGKLGLGGELLSVRFIFTVAAVLLLLPELRRSAFSVPVMVLMTFFAYMLVRSAIAAGTAGAAHQIDFAYLIAQCFLVLTARDRTVLTYMVATSLGVCLLYLVAAVIGQIFPNIGSGDKSGLGWGPIGTVITFSRLQFLGFALSLALTAHHRWAWLPVVVFLYATIASILKAAMLGAGVALLLIVAVLAISRRWKSIAAIAAAFAVAFLAFQVTFVDGAVSRVAKATSTTAQPTETGRFVLSAEFCTYGEDLVLNCRTKSFADASGRLIMVAEAMAGFMRNPLFGNGTEAYSVTLIHPQTMLPERHPYPHNIIAETAFSGGLVGLVLLIAAVSGLAWSVGVSASPVVYKAAVLGLMAFILVASLLGGDLYDARLLWLPAIALASPRKLFPTRTT